MSDYQDKDLPQSLTPAKGQFLVYAAEDGRLKIDVRLENETVWLTQAAMAQLFQCSADNISLHLKNIYEEGELDARATAEEYSVVRREGKRSVSRRITHYNLDAIISVGYRVRSAVATRFRIWATQQLRELIVKGFVLDDERLKNPDQPFDYFEELLRPRCTVPSPARRRRKSFMPVLTLPSPTWGSPTGAARRSASRMSASPRTTLTRRACRTE